VIGRCPFQLNQPHRQFIVLGLSVLLVSGSATIAQRRSPPVLVRYVVDGDTIDVVGIGRVRLLGIDAPELGRGLDTSAPFAVEAQQRLAGLITQRWIRLEYDGRGRDTYRRRLAYVFLETGQFVNELLVREGLARVVARRGLTRLAQLKRAEAAAQTARRGIWGRPPLLPSESYRLPQPRRPPRRRIPRTKSG
jgi:endonuclease YncB( thermonuclease family)